MWFQMFLTFLKIAQKVDLGQNKNHLTTCQQSISEDL